MNRFRLPLGFTLPSVVCLCFAASVCAADKPVPTPAASPTIAAKPLPATPVAGDDENDPLALLPAPTPTPEILADVAAHAKTVSDLWNYIQKYSSAEDLEAIDPSLDQEAKMAKARDLIRNKVMHLRPAVDELLKRYPQDPHRWDAKLMKVLFQQDDKTISEEDADKVFQEVAAAPDASQDAKRQARGILLQEALRKATPFTGLTDDLAKAMAAYENDFPDDPVGAELVGLRIKLLAMSPNKINDLLTTLGKSPNQATARAANEQLALRTQPIDLKFTALDGTEVDVAKLRGKVVLLDFWATWCAPCVAKLPELKEIEKKYQDKGFRLLGISFDEEKNDVTKMVKVKGIDWPVWFESKGLQSDIARRFGLEGLPAAFLLDKEGVPHALDLDADLGAEIDKLLAADSTNK